MLILMGNYQKQKAKLILNYIQQFFHHLQRGFSLRGFSKIHMKGTFIESMVPTPTMDSVSPLVAKYWDVNPNEVIFCSHQSLIPLTYDYNVVGVQMSIHHCHFTLHTYIQRTKQGRNSTTVVQNRYLGGKKLWG